MSAKKHRLIAIPLVLVLASLACGLTGTDSSTESTLQAISNEVRATGSAQASQNIDPNSAAETARVEATAFEQSLVGTQAALSALGADALTSTAIAFQPILATLPTYGVDPAQGRIGWVHPPVTLEVAGFRQYKYVNYFLGTLAADFVVSADITWDTIGNTSGCGFVLRSDGNQAALNQYLVIVTRIASGHVLFATMANGEVLTGRDIYAYSKDKNFNWQNNATNRVTVVGRGNRFWIYTNDTLIGEIDPSAPLVQPALPEEPKRPANQADAQAMALYNQQKAEYDDVVRQIKADFAARQQALNTTDTTFDRGFIAMVALSESGRVTKCQYDNAWLWLIE